VSNPFVLEGGCQGGTSDDPARVAPSSHYWESKRLPWVHFADDLPRHPELPPRE
jgi:hypothetical protein